MATVTIFDCDVLSLLLWSFLFLRALLVRMRLCLSLCWTELAIFPWKRLDSAFEEWICRFEIYPLLKIQSPNFCFWAKSCLQLPDELTSVLIHSTFVRSHRSPRLSKAFFSGVSNPWKENAFSNPYLVWLHHYLLLRSLQALCCHKEKVSWPHSCALLGLGLKGDRHFPSYDVYRDWS